MVSFVHDRYYRGRHWESDVSGIRDVAVHDLVAALIRGFRPHVDVVLAVVFDSPYW